MTFRNFDEFFQAAFGQPIAPFAYQRRLAEDAECKSRLIDIPTGCGKTAAVVLAWLWNRVVHFDAKHRAEWPRRLVYCLPMRTLVEQTRDEVRKWLLRLARKCTKPRDGSALRWLALHSPVILMGGEEKTDWDIHPEREAILIGTQDMLLSRALNRGYAAGRARWPMDFALLNNDCLWVFDEVQLMGSGLTTSLQLQAWRESRLPKLGRTSRIEPATFRRTYSWWMSATLAKHWFEKAVDWRRSLPLLWKEKEDQNERLAKESKKPGTLRNLVKTNKFLERRPVATVVEAENLSAYCRDLGKHVGKHHAAGGLTLIVVNRVNRAVELYKHLQQTTDSSGNLLFAPENIWLVHSRFRPEERKQWKDRFALFEHSVDGALSLPRLIVATQVVEAGVDLSAEVLYTELCPFSSFIQRVGRCARRPGEKGKIFWTDVPDDHALPYEAIELQKAKDAIEAIGTDLSLNSITAFLKRHDETDLFPFDPLHVPQVKDLFELFDTTPDLTGADIDVSPFIRDGIDLDVHVFWREGEWKPRPSNRLQPARQELCPVPVYEFTRALPELLKGGRIFRRDYRNGWQPIYSKDDPHIFPGEVFLLEKACGGYSHEVGWTGGPDDAVTPCPPPPRTRVATDEHNEEKELTGSEWQSIKAHTQDVARELKQTIDQFAKDLTNTERKLLALACTWHDRGKAHQRFQGKLTREARASAEAKQHAPVAKAPDQSWKSNLHDREDREDEPDYRRRKGFRHELASALALLETLRIGSPDHPALAGAAATPSLDKAAANAVKDLHDLSSEDFDLLLYLIAAHHGKVRLSLRSSPDDYDPAQPDPVRERNQDDEPIRRARGVQDGDALHTCSLPSHEGEAEFIAPAVTLSLEPMDIGLGSRYGRSWRERTMALVQRHGPFKLAWLELLLRVADRRASGLGESNSAPYLPSEELAGKHEIWRDRFAAAQTT